MATRTRDCIKVFEGKGLNPPKYFYTTFPVSDNSEEHTPYDPDKLGQKGAKLYQDLTQIRGVGRVAITHHEIRVHKLPAFEWKRVYPYVAKAIEAFVIERLYIDNWVWVEEGWLSISIKRALSRLRSIFS